MSPLLPSQVSGDFNYLIINFMPQGIYKHPMGEKSSHWKGGKPRCIKCGQVLAGYSKMKKNQQTGKYFKVTGMCRKCFMEIQKAIWSKHGNDSHAWRGGRRNDHGYIRLFNPNHPYSDKTGCISEHRLMVEKCIGRYLKSEEIVHHINENKKDNRPENLYLFSNKGHHAGYHHLLKNHPNLFKKKMKSNLV